MVGCTFDKVQGMFHSSRMNERLWQTVSTDTAGALPCTFSMHMPQRRQVEPGLDTPCWLRMTGCAAEGGSSEEVAEKGPLRPGTGRVWCG